MGANGVKYLVEFWVEFERFVSDYDDNLCYSYLDVENLIETFKEKKQAMKRRFDERRVSGFVRDKDGNVNWV